MLDTDFMEAARRRIGLTQEEAARAAGLRGKQVWNDIVNGRRANITLATLDAIAQALQCDPRDLIRPEKPLP